MDDKFLRKMLGNIKCGVCGKRYEATNMNVLGHREDMWFLSLFCSSCKSQGLVAAVIQEGKLTEASTDLTEAEASRFSDPVSSDDLIDMYTYLQEFDGDFGELFRGKSDR